MEDTTKNGAMESPLDMIFDNPNCVEIVDRPLFPALSNEALVIVTGPISKGSRPINYEYYGLRLFQHHIWRYSGDLGFGAETTPGLAMPPEGSHGSGSNNHPCFMIADTLGMPIGVERDGWIQHSSKWWVLKTVIGIERRVGFKIHKGYLVDGHAWALVRVRGEVGLALFSSNGEIVVGVVNKGINNEFNGLVKALSRHTKRVDIAKAILEKSEIVFKLHDDERIATEVLRDNRKRK